MAPRRRADRAASARGPPRRGSAAARRRLGRAQADLDRRCRSRSPGASDSIEVGAAGRQVGPAAREKAMTRGAQHAVEALVAGARRESLGRPRRRRMRPRAGAVRPRTSNMSRKSAANSSRSGSRDRRSADSCAGAGARRAGPPRSAACARHGSRPAGVDWPPSGGSGRLVRLAVKRTLSCADRAAQQRRAAGRRQLSRKRDRSRVSSWNRPSPSPAMSPKASATTKVSPCLSAKQPSRRTRRLAGCRDVQPSASEFERPARLDARGPRWAVAIAAANRAGGSCCAITSAVKRRSKAAPDRARSSVGSRPTAATASSIARRR